VSAQPDAPVESEFGLQRPDEIFAAFLDVLATEVAKRLAPAPEEPPDTRLTSREAATRLRRSYDWFARNNRLYSAALVSPKGKQPRYSSVLLDKVEARMNRAHRG
jgi:hypothetical protein